MSEQRPEVWVLVALVLELVATDTTPLVLPAIPSDTDTDDYGWNEL